VSLDKSLLMNSIHLITILINVSQLAFYLIIFKMNKPIKF